MKAQVVYKKVDRLLKTKIHPAKVWGHVRTEYRCGHKSAKFT